MPWTSLPIQLIDFVDDSQVEAKGVGKTSSVPGRRCILNEDFAEGKDRVWFSILSSLVLFNEFFKLPNVLSFSLSAVILS